MRNTLSILPLIFCAASTVLAQDQPQGRLVEAGKDSGTFFVGASVKGTFEVENTGKVPFKIVEVKSSCHCTTAVNDKGDILPGERGEVSYEMKGTSAGRRTINMRVTTDPPLADPPIFTASATFNPYIQIDMKDIAIEVPQGEPVDHRIPLQLAKEAESLKILGVTSRGRGFDVSLDSTQKNGPALLVKSTEPLPVGKRTVRATLEYDFNGKATQDVLVSLTILGLVQIDPNPIKATFEKDQNEVTATVNLKHTKGKPFGITRVSARGCEIREVALPASPAAEHILTITFVRNPAQRQAPRGFITFDFDGGIGSLNTYALLGTTAAPPGKLPPVQTTNP
ncbi:MAG: DUF1573 domain-containing protein [Candidatus Hydrogenedentes bacterium]|nr:DUF1573 domain-containing protein [Candidatus Hydrogenedentota bacterium]